MLKIGLIGAGWHSLTGHAPALSLCRESEEFRGRVELTGVCDVELAKAQVAAERFGFRRVFASIDALLPEVDAVISIVPPAAMLAAIAKIAQSRRPVLIEKPLGRRLDDARRIRDMLDRHPHMVSLNRRFDPGVVLARRWMLNDASSPPRAIHGIMSRRHRVEPDFVWSTGIHLTDLMCFLAGPLKLTRGRRDGAKRIGEVAGDGGLRGTIEISPDDDRVEETVQLEGDGWSMRTETGTHRPWRVLCRRGESIEIEASADPATVDFIRNGTADETAAFLRGVLSGNLAGPRVADAWAGTELAAALQAADEQPRV